MNGFIRRIAGSRGGSSAIVASLVFGSALIGARYANGEMPAGDAAFNGNAPLAVSVNGRSGEGSRLQSGPSAPPAARTPAPVPFGVGETMQFKLSASAMLVVRGSGEASLRVEAIDTVRGAQAYRLVMAMKGGALGLWHMDDVQRSWLDVNELFSLRFEQKLNQTHYKRDKTYDFFPGTMRYENLLVPDDTGHLATPIPLDDVSLIYHVRTLPITPTSPDISASRYFKQDGNPITVQVLRTERVKVPAGEFDAIVVRPIIHAGGVFGQDGKAEVWLSNDSRRIILKIRAKASVATLTMELQSYTPGTPLVGMPGN